MNILGIGTLELIVIFVIAFIFLGPDRLVQTARFLGKLFADMRRISSELPELVGGDEFAANSTGPLAKQRDIDSGMDKENKDQSTTDQIEGDEDHPIVFQSVDEMKPASQADLEPKKDPD